MCKTDILGNLLICNCLFLGEAAAESTKASLSSAAIKGPGIKSRSRFGTCNGVCACVPSLLIKKIFMVLSP